MTNDSTETNILIVGTGAMGSLYASRLAYQRNVKVHLVCRSNYQTVSEGGIEIRSGQYGNYNFKPVTVFDSVDSASQSNIKFDYVIVLTKALPHILPTEAIIKPVISENTTIVLVQNGLDVEVSTHAEFPNNLLISCVANVAVTQNEDFSIDHVGPNHLSIGLYPKQDLSVPPTQLPKNDKLDLLTSTLEAGKVPYNLVPDIVCVRFQKLVWNGSFSPICILSGSNHCQTIHEEKICEDLVRDSMQEIWDLGEAYLGYKYPDWAPGKTVDDYLNRSKGLKYRPSLLIDFERKRELELELTLGKLVQKASEINFKVPITKTLLALLTLSDKKNRGIVG